MDAKQLEKAAKTARDEWGQKELAVEISDLLELIAKLEGAQFAARQHAQTVEQQAKIINGMDPRPIPSSHRLLPVALHPAIEEALKRYTWMPESAWRDVIEAWDRVKPAACSVCGYTDPGTCTAVGCGGLTGAFDDEAAPECSGKTADEKSIRDYPEFREYLERLSEPGLAKAQAKVIRKEIYDIIDARVRNLAPAASSSAAPSARELDLYDEIECDLPALFGRASKEGHEAGQQLALEVRAKMIKARALATPSVQAVAAGQELTPEQVYAIRDSIRWGDGWDADKWDVALANAVRAHLTKPPALAGDTQAGE